MNDFYKNLPKKRVGAGVLVFNKRGELLILKPSYKDYWTIPGGAVEENESPRQAAYREAKEEIGIDFVELKFLCVDYTAAQDDKNESLQFIFDGGILPPKQNILIDGKEIIDYKFADIQEAAELLGGLKRGLVRRLPKCLEVLKNGSSVYLEEGKS